MKIWYTFELSMFLFQKAFVICPKIDVISNFKINSNRRFELILNCQFIYFNQPEIEFLISFWIHHSGILISDTCIEPKVLSIDIQVICTKPEVVSSIWILISF